MFSTTITRLQEWQHTLPVVLPNLAMIWHVPRPSPPAVLCLLTRDLPLFHSYPSLLHPAEQPGFHIPMVLKIYNFICTCTCFILCTSTSVLHIPCTWGDQREKHSLPTYSAGYWEQLAVITLFFQTHYTKAESEQRPSSLVPCLFNSGLKQVTRKKYKNSTIAYGTSHRCSPKFWLLQLSVFFSHITTHNKLLSQKPVQAGRLLLHPGWAVRSFLSWLAQISLIPTRYWDF